MKELTPKEQMDKYLENGQIEVRNQIYRNKSARFILRILIAISLCLNLACFVLSLIYHETDILMLIGMLAIIILQTMFWFCVLKETCLYYFDKAIANYYYHLALCLAYVFLETLFMDICPIYF